MECDQINVIRNIIIRSDIPSRAVDPDMLLICSRRALPSLHI